MLNAKPLHGRELRWQHTSLPGCWQLWHPTPVAFLSAMGFVSYLPGVCHSFVAGTTADVKASHQIINMLAILVGACLETKPCSPREEPQGSDPDEVLRPHVSSRRPGWARRMLWAAPDTNCRYEELWMPETVLSGASDFDCSTSCLVWVMPGVSQNDCLSCVAGLNVFTDNVANIILIIIIIIIIIIKYKCILLQFIVNSH